MKDAAVKKAAEPKKKDAAVEDAKATEDEK